MKRKTIFLSVEIPTRRNCVLMKERKKPSRMSINKLKIFTVQAVAN